VFEPEALQAAEADSVIAKGKITEMGWFEVAPKQDAGDGVKTFLDKHGERSVVYIRCVRSLSYAHVLMTIALGLSLKLERELYSYLNT
jgi:hypothetical protein